MNYLTSENIKMGLRIRCIYAPRGYQHYCYGKEGTVVNILSHELLKFETNIPYYNMETTRWPFDVNGDYCFEIIEEIIVNPDLKCSICNAPAPHSKEKQFVCASCKLLVELSS